MLFKRKVSLVIGSAFISIGLLAGCSTSEKSESEIQTEETKETETNENQPDKENSGENQKSSEEVPKDDNVIEISAFEMGYTPEEVVNLKKGEEYELVMKNDGQAFHDLTSKELDVEITYMGEMPDHPENTSFLDTVFGVKKVHAEGDHADKKKMIHMNAEAGQTVRIKFIPKEAGEFEFYCSIPGHKEAGMVGKFIVKE